MRAKRIGDPVFVDRSGRRRRLFTVIGAAAGVLLVLALSLLIAGILGASPVPLPGLPANGQLGPQVGRGQGSPTPDRTGATRTPAPTGVTGTAQLAPTSSAVRGNKPSTHPGTDAPKPTRTR